MKKYKQYEIILMIVAAAITVFGLITGKYLFVFVWLPLGFLFGRKKEE
jgi:flagellar biosynthesis component FlhA